MIRPNDLPSTADYHMFKKGIKPMWEVSYFFKLIKKNISFNFHFKKDDANKKGGKWIIRLKKGLATKFWEDLVLLNKFFYFSSKLKIFFF